MMQDQAQNYRPIIIGGSIGVGVGFCLMVFAFLAAISICSDTTIAGLLFPYAVYADPNLYDRPLLVLLVALIQYPIYGVICGYVWMRKRSMVWTIVLVLFVVHIIAIGGAASRIKAMEDKKFSNTERG